MSDIAAARREARRKKILENSSNRLQLISGKNDECLKETIRPSALKNIQEVSRCESPAAAVNGSAIMETFHSHFVATSFSSEIEDTEIENNHIHIVSKSDSNPPTFWQKCLSNKFDVVLMSLVLQVLCIFYFGSIGVEYIFLPLILYTATKIMFIGIQQESQIANILLVLNGIAPQRVQRVMFIAQIFGGFMQNLCIFLFCTICIQFFVITLKEKLIT